MVHCVNEQLYFGEQLFSAFCFTNQSIYSILFNIELLNIGLVIAVYETKYDTYTIEQFRKKYRMLLFFDRYLYVFLWISAALVAYFCTFSFDFTGKDGTYYCISGNALQPLIMLLFAAAALALWSLAVRVILKENYLQFRAAANRGNIRQSRFISIIACITWTALLAILAYQFIGNVSAARADETKIVYRSSIVSSAEELLYDQLLQASVSESGEYLLLETVQQKH